MQSVDLELDSDNELNFMVKVEGSRPGESSCRLMLEGPEMSYSFPGTVDSLGEVTVVIPSMDKLLKEGTYRSDLEVIVDDRIFKPLSLSVNFEKTVRVTAEAVVPKRKLQKVSAAASLLNTSEKAKPAPISVKAPAKPPQKTRPPARVENQIRENKSTKKSVPLSDLNEDQLRSIIRNAFLKGKK
jgi:hypothetical protein